MSVCKMLKLKHLTYGHACLNMHACQYSATNPMLLTKPLLLAKLNPMLLAKLNPYDANQTSMLLDSS